MMLWTVYYLRPHLFGLIEVNHGHNSLRKKMTKPSVRSGSIVSTARLDLTQIVNAQHWVTSGYDAQEVYWRWKCVHKEERDERKKERKVIFYPWEQSESASTLTFCYIFAFDQVDVFLQISFIWNRPFQEFRSEAVGNTPYHLSSFLIILGIWKNDKTAHLRCIRGCGASGTTGKRHHSMVCVCEG